VELATREWGDERKPRAILVHGVTSSSRTWWRVGPWLAANGWHGVAVDLRGHGSSPRVGNEHDVGLDELAGDVYETVAELPGGWERVDVLLGHSLGALTVLRLRGLHGAVTRRIVLEDPPGPASSDPKEIARSIEEDAAKVRQDPEVFASEQRAANPAWAEEDVSNGVANMLDCDAGPVAALIRRGLRYDLVGQVGALDVPTLLLLGSEERDTLLRGDERVAVANALQGGRSKTLDAGHNVHRDDFEGYVHALDECLGGPES
jgi:pimeloyl-ACP methyl ester carboxylesterase